MTPGNLSIHKSTAVVAVLALFLAARSGYAYIVWDWKWVPDFYFYTQGGVGMFPSIPGRILGAMGVDIFVAISVVSVAIIGFAIPLAARRHGNSQLWAAFGLSLSFASIYLMYTGIDPIALAMLAVAYAGFRPLLFAPLAAITHFSILPFAVLQLYRSRPNKAVAIALVFFVGLPAMIAISLTPYSGVIWKVFDPMFIPYTLLGFIMGIILAFPLWLMVERRLYQLTPFILGGLLSGMQGHLQIRYQLPAVMLLAIEARGLAFPFARLFPRGTGQPVAE